MASKIISDLLGTLKNTFKIKFATLSASALTAARTFTLPNKTGYVQVNSYTLPPNANTFAWVNQGTATLTTNTDGTLVLTDPTASGSGSKLRLAVVSAPSPTYSFKAGFFAHAIAKDYLGSGICIRDSGTGKFVFFFLTSSGLGISKFTNATTFSASYTSFTTRLPSLVWLKVTDNNTNFIFSFSLDGDNFIDLYTVSRTDFLASPNQVGLCISVENNTTPNIVATMNVIDWVLG